MKKFTALFLSILLTFNPYSFAETIKLADEKGNNKGLQRIAADKIEDGSFTVFENLYIEDGSIQVIKGRDRLNAAAHADTVVKGMWYYENAAGSTKKIIVKESDEIVSYDTDGTNRTSLLGSLTNEWTDCKQVGDSLYCTSTTDGLYKWTGSGSAAAIAAVAAPSAEDFAATTGLGGMTPGLDIIPAEKGTSVQVETTGSIQYHPNANTCYNPLTTTQFSAVSGTTTTAAAVTSASTDYLSSAQTTSTYSYKTTSHNSFWGIESEASAADTATLSGASTFDVTCDETFVNYPSSTTCAANATLNCISQSFLINEDGRETRTTASSAAAPSAPFNEYCYYRTAAGGEDYFLAFCSKTFSGTINDGKPDVALTRPLDTTIDTITPPAYRYIEEYKGALFLAEGETIQFTRLPVGATTDADKYWLETDKIKTGKNLPLTGLHTVANSMLITTEDTIQELSGFGVDSFRLRNVASGIGCVSDETIETDENGDVICFDGTKGVYKLRLLAQLTDDATGAEVDQPRTKFVKISSPYLDSVFQGNDSEIDLDPSTYSASHAYYDSDNGLYWLFIGQHAFIFNNANSQWTYVPATDMDASVWRKSPTSLGVGTLIDNVGFTYENWTEYENGIESGTVTGHPTSSTNSTVTDSTATFNTTSDGLKGLWIYLDNENGEWRQISSNTGTAITVSSNWTVNPTTADTYYVAYIRTNFKTKQYRFVDHTKKSKVDYFYIAHNKSASTQNMDVLAYMGKETVAFNAYTINLATNYLDKVATPMGDKDGFWQFEGISYVYSTSASIAPPIDIITIYAEAKERDEI